MSSPDRGQPASIDGRDIAGDAVETGRRIRADFEGKLFRRAERRRGVVGGIVWCIRSITQAAEIVLIPGWRGLRRPHEDKTQRGDRCV